jgi:hypothetical protein
MDRLDGCASCMIYSCVLTGLSLRSPGGIPLPYQSSIALAWLDVEVEARHATPQPAGPSSSSINSTEIYNTTPIPL